MTSSRDRVVLRRNDRVLEVENGTRAQVVGVDPDGRVMTIELADGSVRELPSRYLNVSSRSGVAPVEHGHAMTGHLAQGMTTDRTFVLGSETVYREWGYVAWSRARHGTRFYVVEPEVSDEHHTAALPSDDPFAEAVRRLGRSEAQRVGIDSGPQPQDGNGRAGAAKHTHIGYLQKALGPRPETFRRRRRWDKAARRVERYRGRHLVNDPFAALGPRPATRPEAILLGTRAARPDEVALGPRARPDGASGSRS